MIDAGALLIAGAIFVCALGIYFLWLSNNKTKRRLRRLEER